MSDEPLHFHGELRDVISQIIEQMQNGLMSNAKGTELLMGIANREPEHSHDVSVAFRVGLIAMGYEAAALRLREVKMTLTGAGALYQYSIERNTQPDWETDSEMGKAFLEVSMLILRAGFLDARVNEEKQAIEILGSLRTDEDADVEEIVHQFIQELDAEFPDQPPRREGTWW